MRKGHKWRLVSLLGLVLLLVSSIVACEQPSSSLVPSTEAPPTAGEGSPEKQAPRSEEEIFMVEIGKSDLPPRTIAGHDLPGCNLAIRLGSNSNEGIYVHNMVLRSDRDEETVYIGTTLSRRGASTFHVYLTYQRPIVEVVLQGLNGETLFDGTLAAPSPSSVVGPEEKPVVTTKDASEIVLRLEDIESITEGITQHGWSQEGASSAIQMLHEGALSTYGVKFYRSSGTYQQYIFNEVAVFPSIQLAQQAFNENESRLVADTSDPHIGDESWWYVGIGQSITFRKENVLVMIRLTFGGDIKSYGKICESRISHS